MPCEILKLCDLWTWHREGDVTLTVGGQFWNGKLHVSLCRREGNKHYPHMDLIGSESLVLTEKVARVLRQFA